MKEGRKGRKVIYQPMHKKVGQIKHSLIKTLSKVPQLDKAPMENIQVAFHTKEKEEGTFTKMPFLTILFNTATKTSVNAVSQEKDT